jgi:hypothetical protein
MTGTMLNSDGISDITPPMTGHRPGRFKSWENTMNDEHDLTDDQCDRLVALTMDKLAQEHGTRNGAMHAIDLNPSITEHHSLRRSIVRAAYELGKLAGGTQPNT